MLRHRYKVQFTVSISLLFSITFVMLLLTITEGFRIKTVISLNLIDQGAEHSYCVTIYLPRMDYSGILCQQREVFGGGSVFPTRASSR